MGKQKPTEDLTDVFTQSERQMKSRYTVYMKFPEKRERPGRIYIPCNTRKYRHAKYFLIYNRNQNYTLISSILVSGKEIICHIKLNKMHYEVFITHTQNHFRNNLTTHEQLKH